MSIPTDGRLPTIDLHRRGGELGGGGGGGVGSEGEEATQKKKNHPRDEQSVNQKKGGDQSFRPKWDRAKALLRLRQANIYDITTSNQSGCTI